MYMIIITSIATSFLWDTYAFALYFPSENWQLKYPKKATVVNKIDHDFEAGVGGTIFATCHSKVFKNNQQKVCPNKVTRERFVCDNRQREKASYPISEMHLETKKQNL